MKKMFKSKTFHIIVGILVTAVAFWLSLRKIDWSMLWQSLVRVNLIWVFLAVVVTLLTVYALGIRWQLLLKSEGSVSLHSLFQLNIISQCANILMPARAGDVLRVYLASKRHKFSVAHVTGTVVIEKVLDFFVFVLLWILVPSIFAASEKIKGYKIALVLAVLTLGLIFLFIWRQEMLLKWGKTFSQILPARMRDRFVDFFDRSIKAFSPLKDRHNLMVMFILTLVFVGGQVLTNYLLFLAFGLRLSVWVALFLLLALQVGNIPPSSPGKVGVFEVAVIYSLSLFAVPRSQALSYGLVLHAVAFLPKILLGLIYLTKMDISLKKKYSINKNNEI